MINKLFNKILLPKHANDINIIASDISDYWKRTNNSRLACIRYLQDLNSKFELGFNEIEITEIVSTIITKCYVTFDLQNTNTMRLYGEFIYYVVFNGRLPSYVRNRKDTILLHLEKFEDYVIKNPKP
jgi:hypothetical protein